MNGEGEDKRGAVASSGSSEGRAVSAGRGEGRAVSARRGEGRGDFDGRGESRAVSVRPVPSRAVSVRPVEPLEVPSLISAAPIGTAEAVSGTSGKLLEATADRRIGTTIAGRYRIERLVGRGGMGRVYRALQLPLRRAVAVKILSPEFQARDPQFVRRFFLEAASAAKLSHPSSITVFDYGESEAGELFIAMEYLPGQPLSRVISREGLFSPERVLAVSMQICRALREAHGKGIIHRDLKPGNILLMDQGDDGDLVKVLDFGLVKLFSPGGDEADGLDVDTDPDMQGGLTKAGMFLGSPKYMSPEQIQGHELDPRTDIYSLGVLMYQMCTGHPPFEGPSSVDVIYRHVNEPAPSVAAGGGSTAPEVEQIIRRCLAKRPEDRFPDMGALLVHLKDAHRLVTGSSVAETGFGISLDTLRPGPSAPSGRPRPMTRPRQAVVREAAFVDADLTGAGGPSEIRIRRGPSIGTLLVWVAGIAFASTLGVLAYMIAKPPERATPAAAPAPRETVEIRLDSEPSGAEVFRDGQRLGVTPLSISVRADPEGRRVEQLVFEHPGYRDAVVEIPIGTSDVPVKARLAPEERPTVVPTPAAERPESYKDNPY